MFVRSPKLETRRTGIRSYEDHAFHATHSDRDRGGPGGGGRKTAFSRTSAFPQKLQHLSRIDFGKHIRQPLAGVCPGCEVRYLEMDVSSLFGVAGRVALVTGASSGLGLMIAKVLIFSP